MWEHGVVASLRAPVTMLSPSTKALGRSGMTVNGIPRSLALHGKTGARTRTEPPWARGYPSTWVQIPVLPPFFLSVHHVQKIRSNKLFLSPARYLRRKRGRAGSESVVPPQFISGLFAGWDAQMAKRADGNGEPYWPAYGRPNRGTIRHFPVLSILPPEWRVFG